MAAWVWAGTSRALALDSSAGHSCPAGSQVQLSLLLPLTFQRSAARGKTTFLPAVTPLVRAKFESQEMTPSICSGRHGFPSVPGVPVDRSCREVGDWTSLPP